MKTTTFLLLTTLGFTLSAQPVIFAYSYDEAGNRIQRQVVPLRVASPGNTEADQAATREEDLLNELTDPLSEALSISLYPNPAQEVVKINFSQNVELGELRVVDSKGKLYYRQRAKGSWLAGQPLEVPFANLKPGNYFILVNVNGETKQYQIIKG